MQKVKQRSRALGIPFNLTIDDLVIPELCPILKIKLSGELSYENVASVDRIDPKLGYTVGNVHIISYKANTMKSDASFEDLKNFAKWFNGDGFISKPVGDPFSRWYSQVKSRAKSSGIPFSLSKEDFRLSDFCPILGYPLVKNNGTKLFNSATVDRIIPELGYTKGNIQIISARANTMKNNANLDELKLFTAWIIENIP